MAMGREVSGAFQVPAWAQNPEDLVPVQGPQCTGVEDPQENKNGGDIMTEERHPSLGNVVSPTRAEQTG